MVNYFKLRHIFCETVYLCRVGRYLLQCNYDTFSVCEVDRMVLHQNLHPNWTLSVDINGKLSIF